MQKLTYEELEEKFIQNNYLSIDDTKELLMITKDHQIQIENLKSKLRELQSKYCSTLAQNYLLEAKNAKTV
jgi:hypothetical protein